MNLAELPLVLTVAEIAEVLSCNRKTIYNLIDTGELPAISLGRSLRVTRYSLFSFMGLPVEEEIPTSPGLRLVEGSNDA